MAKASTSCFRLSLIALTALVLIGSAHGDAIFIHGNSGSGVTGINCCLPSTPTTVDPGDFLQGYVTATSFGDIGVRILSQINGLNGAAPGSTIASVNPVGTINNFQLIPCFAARCFSFRQINLTLPKPKAADVSVQVFTCLPGSGPDGSCGESEAFIVRDLGASGADINLTIRATMGEVIWNVVANSNEGFEELKNLRFSTSAVDGRPGVVELPTSPDRPTNGPTEGDVIPEPSSMLLLGSGVLVFTQVLRRKLS